MRLFQCAPADSARLTGLTEIDGLKSHQAIIDLGYSIATITPTNLSVTIPANVHLQIINSATLTVANATIVMPAPVDGLVVQIVATGTISHVVFSAPGATIANAPSSLSAGVAIEYIYVASLGWIRLR